MGTQSIWHKLPKPFFVLAPMDDVTDWAFRSIIADCAPPDLFYTEFVNVDGLQSAGRQALLKKLHKGDSDKPIVAQLWGKTPGNYQDVARQMVDMGFDGVDLNMGCPDKTIVKNGCCSALIENRDLALEIISATKAGIGCAVPLSVKTRLGFNQIDLSWHQLLLEQNLDALVVHGRTRKEMSLVPAQWDMIAKVRELRDKIAPNTILVGNGDVGSYADGREKARQSGVDGVMIGRGVFQDPFIFSSQSNWLNLSPRSKLELYMVHIKRYQIMSRAVGKDPEAYAPLKRFCKVYIGGFDGASDIRANCMEQKTADALLEYLGGIVATMAA